MKNSTRIKLFFFVLVTACFCSVSNSFAESFPFRSIAIGNPIPAANVTAFKKQETVNFNSFKGKPFVVVFWGADLPAKKERAIKAFTTLQELLPFFEKRNISILAVNVQDDPVEVIEEVVTLSKSTMPMYVDSSKTLYADLGIFVMPALLLLDKDGKVNAGMGYSHDVGDRLKGDCEILLGEKTKEQVAEAIRPKVADKSPEEKEAMRRLNMGEVLVKKGMSDSAIREYEEAIKIFPAIGGEAYVQLGCLYLDAGKIDEADKMIEKGLKMTPDSLRGQICMAKVMAVDNVQDAINELESLLLRKSQSPDLHYAIGTFYEKLGNTAKSAKEYRKAYELLENKISKE